MPESAIQVHNLTKTYRVPERAPGLRAAARSLFQRQYSEVFAVRQINLSINPGEMVGFIGPNGAGKTTTLKMLSGLLRPTSGEAHILGCLPWERRPAFLKRISMILGNKSQMIWDIPPMDTFRVLGEIYGLSAPAFRQALDELVDLLDMSELLARPVRNLSLGERMKCELVAGLLHRPEVLFLDEPTLGLDVSMQLRLRRFLLDYNQRSGVTVILTSHYMADVMALCPRVILIHEGRLLYDGELNGLAQRLAPFKLLRLTYRAENQNNGANIEKSLPPGVEITERGPDSLTLRTSRQQAAAVTAHLLQNLPVMDLTVEDPPIEAVIDQVYQGQQMFPDGGER